MMIKKNSVALLIILLVSLSACGQKGRRIPPDEKVGRSFEYYERKSRGFTKNPGDSSLAYVSSALLLARKTGDIHQQILALDRFARINEHFGNLEVAVQYQQEAMDIARKTQRDTLVARLTAALGLLKAKAGDLPAARTLLVRALTVFQKLKQTDKIALTYVQLGDSYHLFKKNREALRYYELAGTLLPADTTASYLSLQQKIGDTHYLLGNFGQALRFFEKGIQLTAIDRQPEYRARFLQSASKMHDTLGTGDQARAYALQGVEEARGSGGSPAIEARMLLHLASLVGKEDTQQGIVHLSRALAIANASGNKKLSAEIYNSLHILYKQSARFQQALAALEAYHHLSDSLLLKNKEHQLLVLQRSYQLLESRTKIEGLQIENQKRTSERNSYLFLAVFIGFALVAAGLYLYRIRELNKRLSESNAVKDKLFSIIGHDLKNPIGGITQLLALIEEGDVDEPDKTMMITEMRKQGQAALDILDSLLQWGRAQLKGIEPLVSDFAALPVIENNMQVLASQLSDKLLEVQVRVDPDLKIRGDRNHFDFVIRNLLSNAVKFSHQGGVIEISAHPSKHADKTFFNVKDHGKGISLEQQKKFISGTLDISYGTRGEKGTGIGLTLSKEFVRANNGTLSVESIEGKGATFLFSYPTAQ